VPDESFGPLAGRDGGGGGVQLQYLAPFGILDIQSTCPPPPSPIVFLHIFPNPFYPLPSGASRMTDMENKPSGELHKEQSQAAEPQLKRSLGARHLQMLAIASSIGTGLFIGSGKALSTGGPFSLVFSFAWLGLVLTTMMRKCIHFSSAPNFPLERSFNRGQKNVFAK